MNGSPLAGGPHRDFEELYAAHFHALTVQLYAYAGDMDQARDLVQEAFCRAYIRWKKISTYDDPLGWIRRVAWNLATSHWRRLRTATGFASQYREEYAAPPEPRPGRAHARAEHLAGEPASHRRPALPGRHGDH